MKAKKRIFVLVSAGILWMSGCGGRGVYKPPELVPDDRADITEPREREILISEDAFEYAVMRPTQRTFDLARSLRKIAGNPRQAMNCDAFGNVQDSSWFTNRNGRALMPLDEIARGPNTGTGPETEGPWKISSAKDEGLTPGFNITDARGDKYVIKFDPFGFLELSSAAEVICTKIFYAAGYNVPENYIVYFDPAILEMDDTCVLYDEFGIECEMTVMDFDRLMERVQKLPDGRVRALASKYLKGKPLGGFRYVGTRPDDPNDIIPHEFRRELRGLYALCAWVKHFDIKDANSLDMYVEEEGRRYVKHYLLDFGTTLGATPAGPMPAFRGHETEFDIGAAFKNLFTLGLVVRDWEKAADIIFPSIGRFDADNFDPGNAIMNYPNPALINHTNLDGYWGVKLVMSFTDEQLKVIVREGQFTDPSAEAYLLDVLKERRDMTGRYWYSKVNPLDRFMIDVSGDGIQVLNFTDMGIAGRLWSPEQTRYQYSFRLDGTTVQKNILIPDTTFILLDKLAEVARRHRGVNKPISAQSQWEIILRVSRDNSASWSKWVKVFLNRDPETGRFILLGTDRQN